ncbi:MAG: ribonuclease P protein component [Clostridiales bacterium]|nr:ribonuclease P protein component [Clostridiales bacterium]MCF8021510.1 ribonuclease P protein component [Clostridiales bacterium]
MSRLKILKKNKEYKRVINKGYSVVNKKIVLLSLKNNYDSARFGFSISKRIGNAVKRNRLRRLFKEICRLNMDSFEPGYNYVIIARKGIKDCDFYEVKINIITMAKKLQKKINKINNKVN